MSLKFGMIYLSEVKMEKIEANAKRHYEVTSRDLPLSCPAQDMVLWNSHPRVYLPIEATGKVVCPYCEAEYVLVDFEKNTD